MIQNPHAESGSSPPPKPVNSLNDILEALSRTNSLLTKSGTGWVALCPAHDDTRQSLSVHAGKTQPFVLKCHAGCTFEQVMAALRVKLGLSPSAPQPASTASSGGLGEIVAVYDYCDERGRLAYQVTRHDPKTFRQRHVTADGTLVWGLPADVPRYLYRLHELRRKTHGREHPTVYIAEGEKDCDGLWELKLPATTNVGGAGKWRGEYIDQLVEAGVTQAVIFADNDDAGQKHAHGVAAALHAAGLTVKIVELPGLPEKGDVSDYLAAHTKEELFEVIRNTNKWTSDAEEVEDTPSPDVEQVADTRFRDYIDTPYSALFYGPGQNEEEPLDYHWDGFTVRGSVVTILGAKKHAKSWFADLLMVSAAAREPIFPGFPFGCQRVLLLNGPRENTDHETKRRLRAIHQQYGITPRDNGEIRVRSYRRAALRLDQKDESLFTELLDYIRAYQPDAIRLDSVGALWGGKNESDNSEVRTWMEQRLDPLLQAAAPGCTLYLLAHTGHAIRDGKVTYAQRHQRGASGWGDSTDTLLLVEKVEPPAGSPHHHVVSTIGMEYTRLGPETDRQVQLTISGGPGTGEQLGVTLAEVLPEMVEPTDVEKALQLAVEALQKATEPVTQSDIYKILKTAGLGRNVGREALWVLRGSAPWPSGQYKGTRRTQVREEGKKNNSPVLRWIGPSGEMWTEEPDAA
jgi:hypothetical protein